MDAIKWLYPGLRVKRWIALAVFGILLLAVGMAISVPVTGWRASGAIGWAVFACGAAMVTMGLRNTVRSILGALAPHSNGRFIDQLYRKRFLEKGEQIVVIGGGTGLSTLLRGLKIYTSNITAIVTVADDGGSSGVLRRDMGVLPPGDIRNCLVALADTESLMEDLFRYRYKDGGFKGHSFGNLFIATLSEVAGDFEMAVKLSSKVLAVRGQVLPSTLSDVALKAVMADGRSVFGESAIPKAGGRIERVELVPPDVYPPDESIEALEKADVIVLGPGSLYTSVIPNLLVTGVADVIRKSKALKIYICNVMTQPGETTGYSVYDHVAAVKRHVGDRLIDYVLVNTGMVGEDLLEKYRKDGAEPVKDDSERLGLMGIHPVKSNMASLTEVVRHDPDRLASAVLKLLAKHQMGRGVR